MHTKDTEGLCLKDNEQKVQGHCHYSIETAIFSFFDDIAGKRDDDEKNSKQRPCRYIMLYCIGT